MKVLVIPDVHQTAHWKKAIADTNWEEIDHVVFLGDYFDTHGGADFKEADEVLNNLQEIIDIKKANKDKVTVLVGNHDLHYFFDGVQGSQYQRYNWPRYHDFLMQNSGCFELVKELDGWVFSHAGISNTWAALIYERNPDFHNMDPIAAANEVWKLKQKDLLWYIDSFQDYWGTGDAVIEGPCWIRVPSLLSDSLFDNVVVGHTALADKKPFCVSHKGTNLICLDTEDKNLYMVLDTQNPPRFLSLEELAAREKQKQKSEYQREVKKQKKEANDLKSLKGQFDKELMERYNIKSKSEFRRILAQNETKFVWGDETLEEYKKRVDEAFRKWNSNRCKKSIEEMCK